MAHGVMSATNLSPEILTLSELRHKSNMLKEKLNDIKLTIDNPRLNLSPAQRKAANKQFSMFFKIKAIYEKEMESRNPTDEIWKLTKDQLIDKAKDSTGSSGIGISELDAIRIGKIGEMEGFIHTGEGVINDPSDIMRFHTEVESNLKVHKDLHVEYFRDPNNPKVQKAVYAKNQPKAADLARKYQNLARRVASTNKTWDSRYATLFGMSHADVAYDELIKRNVLSPEEKTNLERVTEENSKRISKSNQNKVNKYRRNRNVMPVEDEVARRIQDGENLAWKKTHQEEINTEKAARANAQKAKDLKSDVELIETETIAYNKTKSSYSTAAKKHKQVSNSVKATQAEIAETQMANKFVDDTLKSIRKVSEPIIGKENAKTVIASLNEGRLKTLAQSKLGRYLIKYPGAAGTLGLAATAGIGLFLYSRAIQHKRFEQGY